jgi:hypothetical protein
MKNNSPHTALINQATNEMKMSYVKALKIIKKIEVCRGGKILKTTTGGKDYGGSKLHDLSLGLEKDVALLRSRNILIDVIFSLFPHFSMITSGFLGFFPQMLSTASYNASSSAYLIPFHSIEPSLNFKAAIHCVLTL